MKWFQSGNRRRRRFYFYSAVLLLSAGALLLYLNSAGFTESLRRRTISEIEFATGARVEIAEFHWSVLRLRFEARNLVLHGSEAVTEPPLLQVDRMFVGVEVFSYLKREFGARYLEVDHPRVNIRVRPDGATNVPVPPSRGVESKDVTESLFAVYVLQLTVRNGELRVNDQVIPMDFSAENVSTEMRRSPLIRKYDGLIRIDGEVSWPHSPSPIRPKANLAFSLTPGAIEVPALHVETAGSKLDAKGKVVDLTHPRPEFEFHAALSLDEVASFAGRKEIKNGILDLQGKSRIGSHGLEASGNALLRDVDFANDVSFKIVNAGSKFQITGTDLALNNLVVQALGGSFQGDVRAHDWMALASKAQSAKPATGDAIVRIHSVDLASVLSVFSTPSLRLNDLKADGAITGTAELKLAGAPMEIESSFNLDIQPAGGASSGSLSVTAGLRGRHRFMAARTELDDFTLDTDATHIEGSGVVGDEKRSLNASIESTHFAEWRRLLVVLGASSLPVEADNDLRFEGTLTGHYSGPALRGHLELGRFDTIIPAPFAENENLPRRHRWDGFSGEIEYSPSAFAVLHGEAYEGKTTVAVNGRLGAVRGAFPPGSPVTADFSVKNLSASVLQTSLGVAYPIAGALDLDAHLSGAMPFPSVKTTAVLHDATAWGEPVTRATADVTFDKDSVGLRNAVVELPAGRANGQLEFAQKGRALAFQLHAQGLDVSAFRFASATNLRFAGSADLDLSGSGTLDDPGLHGTLAVNSFAVNGEPAGTLRATAQSRGHELTLKLGDEFNDFRLEGGGAVQMQKDWPAALSFRFDNLDYSPLLRATLGKYGEGHSAMDGEIQLRGPLAHPQQLSGDGKINDLSAVLENVKLNNEGPILFDLREGTFHLTQFKVRGEDTDLTLTGSLESAQPHRVNLSARGSANLRLFQSFNRDLVSYGTARVQLDGTGALARPDWDGKLDVENAGFSFIDLPNGLSNVNGTLLLHGNRLQIQKLAGQTGGGTLVLGGSVTYRDGPHFELTAQAKEVRFRYPPGVSSVADADLRFNGTTANSLLSGVITVDRISVNPRFDFASYLATVRPSMVTTGMPTPVLSNLHLDVRVTTASDIRLSMATAQLAGDADLSLRGTASRPAVLGRVNISEGEINFNGTKYRLERGDITFTNPVRIEPTLNLEATSRVRDYDITLGFHGPIDRLSTTYRSEPPLPTADIIALLALGRTREDTIRSATSTSSYNDAASAAILSQALNATLSNRAQQVFGISRLKIDPSVGGPENTTNARVTVEQQVSNNVTLTYITNLSQSSQTIIQGVFKLNRDLSINVIRDQNGVLGVEFQVRKRKK